MTHLAHINPLLFAPGDALSRDEFLALWERMPAIKFAELIDGLVYIPSPLSFDHGRYDLLSHAFFRHYCDRSGRYQGLANATWLMLESAPQPDLALRLLPEFGGRTEVENSLAKGVPDLVVEVVRSSRSYDLGPKLALYQRAGVPELVAALTDEKRIQWRVLQNGSYQLLSPEDGIFRSPSLPGLWLDEQAFWADDLARLLATLQKGLATLSK
ncbi:MAG: Uma2 family endonuclease [Bryobacteraceae bacterium]|nr:Uma2 family endonuclease [Bryobacteraceae bacterium]